MATLATVGTVGAIETAACGGDIASTSGSDGGTIFTVADAYGVADVFAPDTSMMGVLYGVAEQPDSAEPDVVISADAAYGVAEIPDAEPDSVSQQDADHEEDGGVD